MVTMTNTCCDIFVNVCKGVVRIAITIFVTIAVILLPIVLSPLFFYRYCLRKCAPFLRPDLGEMLACGNNLMSSYDDIYGKPENTTVICVRVKGITDIENARKQVSEKLINAKNGKKELKYPELKQYHFMWMGYYFWKNGDFDVKNHVNNYDGEVSSGPDGKYSEADAASIEAELVTKPHIKERSPWEIVIVPNVQSDDDDDLSEYSYIYFRNSHGLMDGFALYQIIVGDLCGEDIKELGALKEPTTMAKCLGYLFKVYTYLFRIPYDIAWVAVNGLGVTTNDFRLEYKDLSINHIGTIPLHIPLEHLKEARKQNNVSMASTITAIWLGGLRRMMLEKNMKIPRVMQFGCPMPAPGHKGNLRVHASAASLTLPVGIKDSIKRLKAIEEYMSYVKKSSAGMAVYILKPIIGSMLPPMINASVPYASPTGSINIFAGPPKVVWIFGNEVAGFHFSYGQQKYRNSILFSSLTYCDTVSVKITVNTSIFSRQDEIKNLYGHVQDELDFLRKHNAV